MNEELKPCPWCGQLPVIESIGEDGYYITCSNMDCESVEAVSPEAWNIRPVENALRDEIELLKQTLADNEAYGLAMMAERDTLKAQLNQAVYMQEKVRAERNTAEDLAERLRKQVKADEEFHPRAVKLLRKRKPFLVVAIDESYYRQVYDLIRDHEILRGEWSTSDQWRYEDAIAAWKDGQK